MVGSCLESNAWWLTENRERAWVLCLVFLSSLLFGCDGQYGECCSLLLCYERARCRNRLIGLQCVDRVMSATFLSKQHAIQAAPTIHRTTRCAYSCIGPVKITNFRHSSALSLSIITLFLRCHPVPEPPLRTALQQYLGRMVPGTPLASGTSGRKDA